MNKTYIALGAVALVAVAAFSWNTYVDQQAEKHAAELLNSTDLADTLKYKKVTGGWLGNSLTLHEATVSAGDADITAKSICLTGRGLNKGGALESLSVKVEGLDAPTVISAKNGALSLSGLPTQSLAALGYTRLQGDLAFHYAPDPKNSRQLQLGLEFDLDDLGEASMEMVLDKVELEGVGDYIATIQNSPFDLRRKGSTAALFFMYLKSQTDIKLASAEVRYKDDGLRERLLMLQREQSQFLGDIDEYSQTLADDLRKDAKSMQDDADKKSLVASMKAAADFVQKGGSIEGETNFPKPVPIFSSKGLMQMLEDPRYGVVLFQLKR